MLYVNGDSYTGTFYKGKFHGYGEIKFANKDQYEGEFIDGMKSGVGTLTGNNNGKI